MNASTPDGDPIKTEEMFYVQTYRRLMRVMAALALAGTAGLWFRYRPPIAAAFLAGSLLAMLNFHWLKRTLDAIGERLQTTGRTPSNLGVVLRFVLRYVLIALVAYVILKSSAGSLYAFFAGLLVSVGAILAEAVYQTYRALRTGA